MITEDAFLQGLACGLVIASILAGILVLMVDG